MQFQTSLTLHKWFCLLNMSFLCSGKLLLVLQTRTWVRSNQDENGNCEGSEAGECVGILLSWWGQNLVFKGRLDWSLRGEILPQIWSPPSLQDKKKKNPKTSFEYPTTHSPSPFACFLGFPNLTCPNRTYDSLIHLPNPKAVETSLTQPPQYLTSSLSANLTPSYPSPHCHPCPSLTISWLHHCITSNPLSSSNLAPTFHSLQSSQSSLFKTWIWSCHPLLKTLQWLPIIFRRLRISLNRPTRPPYVLRSACSPASFPARFPCGAQEGDERHRLWSNSATHCLCDTGQVVQYLCASIHLSLNQRWQ